MNIIFMREWLSWWSTTLPRSGSRVRVPSRALLNSKNTSASDVFFSLLRLAPARGFVSTLRFGPRITNVHWTLCFSVPLRSAQSQRPPDVVRRLALFYLCIECKNDVAAAFCQFFTHHMHIFLQWYFFFVLI